jgi:hypothetical protein
VAIIIRDFSKGLRTTYIAKATMDLRLTNITKEPLVYPLKRDLELLEATKVIITKASRKP